MQIVSAVDTRQVFLARLSVRPLECLLQLDGRDFIPPLAPPQTRIVHLRTVVLQFWQRDPFLWQRDFQLGKQRNGRLQVSEG